MTRRAGSCALALALALGGCGRVAEIQDIHHVPRFSGNAERITFDLGGVAERQYREWHDRAKAHQIKGYVVDGTCASWCAFAAFQSPASCYTENARVGFHLATQYGIRTEAVAELNEWLIANLVDDLEAYVRSNVDNWTVFGGHDLTYADLIRIYPAGACPDLG